MIEPHPFVLIDATVKRLDLAAKNPAIDRWVRRWCESLADDLIRAQGGLLREMERYPCHVCGAAPKGEHAGYCSGSI